MKNTFEDLKVANVGKYQGVLNKNEEFVVPPIYDLVIIWSYGIEVKKDGKCGGYDFDGKLIVPCKYASIDFNYKYFVTVSNFEKLYGAYNYEGKLVIPVEYANVDVNDSAGIEYHGRKPKANITIVEDVDGDCGVYNDKGMLIVMCKYMSIDVISEFIVAEMYNRFEVYTFTGKKIISVDCSFVDVRGGFIVAMYDENDDITIYNTEGKWLVSSDCGCVNFRYDKYYFAIKEDDRWKVYDQEGKCLNEVGYYDVYFADKFVNVVEDGYWKVLCQCE